MIEFQEWTTKRVRGVLVVDLGCLGTMKHTGSSEFGSIELAASGVHYFELRLETENVERE